MTEQAPPPPDDFAPRPVREKLDLTRHFPFVLGQISRLVSIGASRALQKQFNIGVREWRVLAILGDHGVASAADMVGPAASDKATVSRAINALESAGYLERLPDQSDRRKQQVRLTQEGVALHDQIVPLARLRARVLESALTEEERETLLVVLAKLKAQVEWLEAEENRAAAKD